MAVALAEQAVSHLLDFPVPFNWDKLMPFEGGNLPAPAGAEVNPARL